MEVSTLNSYYERGLLTKQNHPSLPLTIWNYTEKVQYESLWDEITLNCRGLITDDSTGKVIVEPFGKFFNYEELISNRLSGIDIPVKGDYVYVQEKADGSLGILFWYGEEWIMATRGSFTSEQAVKGLQIVKKNFFLQAFPREYGYLVEIIYPENRIVVNYKKEKIVFLSVVLNRKHPGWKSTDESELHWTNASSIFSYIGIRKKDIVKTEQHFNFSDSLYESLKSKNEKNKEGFVLRYHPGNFRMKIKFEEYIRLHRIMTNLSTTSVWEILSQGRSVDEILKDVPDEFYQKVRNYEEELTQQFESLKAEYLDHFESIRRLGTRKLFAQFANVFRHPNLLFQLLDNRDISKSIWTIIKPEFRKL